MKKILAGILLALLCAHDAVIQAARTFSAGTTHRVYESAYTTNHTSTTWAIWTYRTGEGGSNFGRMWMKGSNSIDGRLYTNNSANYQFDREASTSDGNWAFTKPAANVWAHIAITYSSSALANDPIIYVNGSSVALAGDTNPTGTISNNSEGYCIGNFENAGSPSQNWGGSLADFAVWDAILNAGEIAALGKGVSPLWIRPANLKLYMPITGLHTTEPDYSTTRAAGTVTSATLTAHAPPIQSIFSNYGAQNNDVSSGGAIAPLIYLQRRRR